ncbi:uncharacterized protein LY89DRAFT_669100 [Mollisia scopiformis]|uniref:Uncharacterized protein n=1 Tax=Mollisia scopiformis TaxID=149040 RepID=A0A194XCB3_MOLSC|nr:uncharacterized protein LY89DRAFT_669100 [Mollisia scopiformis]KUJ17813.1 hypothetical protein LY89DRAFT_669100 [Mollisia scopiformis]
MTLYFLSLLHYPLAQCFFLLSQFLKPTYRVIPRDRMNPPPPNDRFAKAKNIARTSLKRFGPLLLTGLAAVVEHHWLKRDDDPPPPEQPQCDDRDRSSIKELKHEVKKLRKKLKGKRKYRDDSSSSSDSSSTVAYHQRVVESPMRGRRRPLGEEQTRERDEYYRGFETRGNPPPPVPDPPQQYQRYQTFQPPQLPHEMTMLGQASSSRDIQRPPPRQVSHHRPRPRRRHHSLPSIIDAEFSPTTIHAGKVAAVAGFIEALHVGDFRGDWIGRKGARVGTTMAASFGASVARDKDPRDLRRREIVMDVGKGLAVSRLVHGRVERVEDGYRRRGRRWSSSF